MAEVLKQPATVRPKENFPDDVLIEILSRLPVRSLLLFRSVSKHWLNLIQTPTFINLHTNRPINYYNDHNPVLILRTINTESPRINGISLPINGKLVLALLSDSKTLAYKDEVALEVISPSIATRGFESTLDLLGPCNGVFCVADTIEYVLFNPATRRYRNIPTSPYRPQSKSPYDVRNSSYDYVGFGFDPVSNDYKLVTFDEINKPEFADDHDNYDDEDVDDDDDGSSFDDENDDYQDDQEEFDEEDVDDDDDFDDDVSVDDFDDDDVPAVDVVYGDDGYFEGVHFKVEIYSLSSNCWRELNCVIPDGKVSTNSIHYRSFYFNGALHWLGGFLENFSSILVFDLNKETFKRFELPEIYIEEQVYLSVLTESLTMIVHNEFNYSRSPGVFEIWVMSEYGVDGSWRKLYNICPDVVITKPLSFREVEFLIKNEKGQLVSYNHITKVTKILQVLGDPSFLRAFRYRESLVSLK